MSDVVLTYAFPSMHDRLVCSAAAIAHYARYVEARLFADLPVMPMCLCCGMGTGNWCDACEVSGVIWLMPGTATDLMRGSPLCTECEEVLRPCRVCAGRVIPPAIPADADLPGPVIPWDLHQVHTTADFAAMLAGLEH